MSRMNSCNMNSLNTGIQVSNQSQMQSLTQITKTNFLTQFIGHKCTCEFYIDSNIIKKTGLLDRVGTDFVVLTSTNNPDEKLICSLEELKFIKFY